MSKEDHTIAVIKTDSGGYNVIGIQGDYFILNGHLEHNQLEALAEAIAESLGVKPNPLMHSVELTERELRALLSAIEYATENGPRWWAETKYVTNLYRKLLGQPIRHRDGSVTDVPVLEDDTIFPYRT